MRKNGEIVPVEVSVSAIRGGYFQAILRDVSERKKAEALLAAEKRVLEMIATGVPLKEILNALCLFIEEQRSRTLASVLLLNQDGIHLDVAAGPNLPQSVDAADGVAADWTMCRFLRHGGVSADPRLSSPTSGLTRYGTCRSIASAALKHGLRASWSNPVLSSKGKVLGHSACTIANHELRARKTWS